MAIRIGEEELLSLADAAKRLPRKNSGKRVHVAALYRWASTGCRGVVLETLQVGGQRFTSMAALQRFAEELTNSCERCQIGSDPASRRVNAVEVGRAAAEVDRLLGSR